MEQAAETSPDLALVDLGTGGEADGVEVGAELGRRFDLPVIYLTDGTEEELLERAEAGNPSGFVLKPVEEPQLRLTMKTALSFRERQRESCAEETRLKREVDASRNRNQVLENILDSISDAVVAIDGQGDYLVFNASARRLFGPPAHGSALDQRSEKYGFFLPDRVSPFPDEELPMSRALSGMCADDVEIFVSDANAAAEHLISVSARPILNDGRQVIGAVCISRDIGSEREAEAAKDQAVSEATDQLEFMEAVLDHLHESVILSDGTNRILYMNRQAKQISGLNPDSEMMDIPLNERSRAYGVYFSDGKTPVPTYRLPLVSAVRGEETGDQVLFIRNQGNAEGTYVGVRGIPLMDAGGSVVKAGLVIGRDIGECGEALSRWEQIIGHGREGPPFEFPGVPATEEKSEDAPIEPVAAREGAQDAASEAGLEEIIAEMHHQAQLMEAVYDNMSDGIIVADPQGSILFANKVSERIFGEWIIDPDFENWSEKFGVYYPGIKTPVPVEQLPLTRAMFGEETEEIELFVRNRKNTAGTYIAARGIPIFDASKTRVLAGLVLVRDVTGDRLARETLDRTRQEFRDQAKLMETVFESMREGLVVVDTAGRVVLNNASAERIMGGSAIPVPPEQWAERYGIYLSDGKTRPPIDEIPLIRAIHGETTDEEEYFVRNETQPTGIYISASARPLKGAGDGIIGAVGILREITKRKLAEVELENTVRKLRFQAQLSEVIFNSMSDGLIVADSEGKFTVFNESAENIVGIGMIDRPPEQWTEEYGIFYPDQVTHVPMENIPLVRTIRGEDVNEMELFIRNEFRPAGVHISVDGRPLHDDVEGHAGGMVVFRDITAHRQAQTELDRTIRDLREHDELMETTFNSISDGLVVANEKGEFLYVNPAAEQITGMGVTDTPPEEWARRYGSYYPDRQTPYESEDLPLLRAIYRQEETNDVDIFLRNEEKQDGVFIRVAGRPLLNEVGGVRGGVITFRDITEEMNAEEALARAFAQGRLEIVDTILHNIGNAINSVTVGIETVRHTLNEDRLLDRLSVLAQALEAHRDDWADYVANDPQGRQALPFVIALAKDFARQNEVLAKTVERVSDRADHIADIIRTQKAHGSPSMDRKDINLENALNAAVRVLQDSISKRDVRIDIDLKDAPKEIRIQESQFHQMIVNLIKNALEAVDELAASGGLADPPRIGIGARGDGDFLNLEVSDNGIGFDDDEADRFFSAGYTTKEAGTGLGLHSVANFVVSLGGEIHPFSDGPGKGATLRVRLRLPSVLPPPPPPPPHARNSRWPGLKNTSDQESSVDGTTGTEESPHSDRR